VAEKIIPQDIIVEQKLEEENRISGFDPKECEERIPIQRDSLQMLLYGELEDSFEVWNLLRRCRQRIIKIEVNINLPYMTVIYRRSPILDRYGRNIPLPDYDTRKLILGTKDEAFKEWGRIRRSPEIKGMVIDVMSPRTELLK